MLLQNSTSTIGIGLNLARELMRIIKISHVLSGVQLCSLAKSCSLGTRWCHQRAKLPRLVPCFGRAHGAPVTSLSIFGHCSLHESITPMIVVVVDLAVRSRHHRRGKKRGELRSSWWRKVGRRWESSNILYRASGEDVDVQIDLGGRNQVRRYGQSKQINI